MTKLYGHITYILAALLALLLYVCIGLTCGGVAICYAATASNVVYTTALEDLQKDSSFKTSNYPEAANDYSIDIIQLAESSDKELFVYTYQPSGQTKQLVASSINISTTINDSISFYNYKLELLNSSSVFYKYKVAAFEVVSDPTRYYAISSIYRPYDATIDNQADHGNTVTEVNYDISKQYCFSTINGNPYVQVVDIETITITDKFVGFVRYKDGFQLYIGACDSHFVAFNTDKRIDKLLEADVYYTTQEYSTSWIPIAGDSETFGEKSDEYAYLKYTDKVEHTGGGIFAGTYKWDRIETTEQFISENETMQNVYSGALIDVNVASNITEEGKAALRGKKWVLRFAETSYMYLVSSGGVSSSRSTIVGDVTILRLKFETDGITYNLGTIDNKQSGSRDPINDETFEIIINTSGKWILSIGALIILIVLLIVFFPVIAPILSAIFRFLWWLISAPFRAISRLIKGGKDKDGGQK